jgi:hypothetical protein
VITHAPPAPPTTAEEYAMPFQPIPPSALDYFKVKMFDENPWSGRMCVGLFIGGICGLLPLTVGKRRGRIRLGVWGFFTCLASGVFWGLLLALPVSIIFTLVILILGKSEQILEKTNPLLRILKRSWTIILKWFVSFSLAVAFGYQLKIGSVRGNFEERGDNYNCWFLAYLGITLFCYVALKLVLIAVDPKRESLKDNFQVDKSNILLGFSAVMLAIPLEFPLELLRYETQGASFFGQNWFFGTIGLVLLCYLALWTIRYVISKREVLSHWMS